MVRHKGLIHNISCVVPCILGTVGISLGYVHIMLFFLFFSPRTESDYHLVVHMIGQNGAYFKGLPLVTGMYFHEKSLATGVKLLYFP